jgi:hypothetical protein
LPDESTGPSLWNRINVGASMTKLGIMIWCLSTKSIDKWWSAQIWTDLSDGPFPGCHCQSSGMGIQNDARNANYGLWSKCYSLTCESTDSEVTLVGIFHNKFVSILCCVRNNWWPIDDR